MATPTSSVLDASHPDRPTPSTPKDGPSRPGEGTHGPRGEPRLLVWAIIASQFAPPFMFSGVAVALPSMGAGLGTGAVALGLVETLFLAGSLAVLLPVGRLADAADKRTMFKAGLLGFALTSVAIGALSWVPGILALRFLQGVCAAVFSTTGPAILAEIVPPARRGRAFGASIGAIYTGLTIGPIAGGLLVGVWDWRAVFFAGALVLLAGLALVHWQLRSRWHRAPRGTLHAPSVALLFAAVLTLVAATAMPGALAMLATLAMGMGFGAVFVWLQRRLAGPLLDVGALVLNRRLRDALAVQLLLYMNVFAAFFMCSVYMQVTLGHDPARAGQVLALGSVVMAVLAPIAGRLSDRLPPRWIATVGCAAVFCSGLMATQFDAETSLAWVAATLAVQGVGYALFSSPNMTIIMGSVPPSEVSLASALGAKSRSLGMVIGMLLTGIMLALAFGHDPVAEHAEAFAPLVQRVFSILMVATAVAFAWSVWSARRGHAQVVQG